MSDLQRKIQNQVNRGAGIRTLLTTKIDEFMGHAQMQSVEGCEQCRCHAHALLDAYFDQVLSVQHDIRKYVAETGK